MPNRVQILRSNVPGNRPPAGQLPGSMYVNWPDGQLGVVNAATANQDLIAVRFFSALTSYNIGDHVFYNGSLYKATAAVAPGAFNPNQWTAVGGSITISDTPPANPQSGSLWWDSVGGNLYVYYNDGTSAQWVVAVNMIGGYLPLGGGNLTGPLNLAADPTTPLGAATKEYVDAGDLLAQSGGFGGFVNRLRNGTFEVWQRGSSISVPAGVATMTADGWYGIAAGVAMTVALGDARASPPTSGGVSIATMLTITGAAGLTNASIQQNIESFVAAVLDANIVTFQAQIYNNTGAAFTPQLAVNKWTTADTPSSAANDLGYTNLQPCPNGVWTRVAYTYLAGALGNGAGVYLNFGNALNGAANRVYVAAADFRVTPKLPIGLCSNPPPPEMRPAGMELSFCQRYYQQTASNFMCSGYNAAGATVINQNFLPVRMRAAPTVGFGTPSYSNASALAVNNVDGTALRLGVTVTATGFGWGVANPLTLSAEL